MLRIQRWFTSILIGFWLTFGSSAIALSLSPFSDPSPTVSFAPDTTRILNLIKQGTDLMYNHVSSSDSLLRLALSESRASYYDFGIAKSATQLGIILRNNGDFETAMSLFQEADSLYSVIKKPAEKAYLLNEISILFANTGEIDKSRNYFKEALVIFENVGDLAGQGQMNHNIAVTYDISGDLDSAMYFYYRGYKMKEAAGDSNGVATSLNNLAVVTLDIGKIDSALYYATEAFSMFEKLGNKLGLMTTYNQIGKVYEAQGSIQKALPYYLRSYETAKELGNLENLVDKSETLKNAYRSAGKFELALQYYDEFVTLHDSLQKQINKEAVSTQKVEFELKRKEAEVQALKEQQSLQNRIRFILLLGLISLGVFTLIFFRERVRLRRLNKELRQKSQEISVQSDALNQQNFELKRLNEVKDRLFTIISHDMRGPLHTMSGFLELMKEGQVNRDEMIRISTNAFEEIGRTSDLLTNLLIWANAQLTHREFIHEMIPLHEVANDVVDLYKFAASQKNIKLESSLSPNIKVLSDRSAVHLVIRNLIGNAVKFTPRGKQVGIRVDEISSSSVKVAIYDEGRGMDEETIEKVFSNYQMSTLGTNNEKGTGIGLFITREVAEKVGISLEVQSEKGKGTTFYLTFEKALPS